MVFLHFATKHAQTAKKWGKITFPSTDFKFATVYHCSCKKTQQTQGMKIQEVSPIEPYTKIPVVLFSTPRSRKIIAHSVKIAHAEK